MALFGSILRARRGHFNFFVIAALVALMFVPGASHAAIPPQSCEAVLFWLHSESAATIPTPVSRPHSLLSISHQNAESAPQTLAETQFSVATSHCGQFSAFPTVTSHDQIAPATLSLERHVAARLSGVRTNRRLI
jgi:hypothetical protein